MEFPFKCEYAHRKCVQRWCSEKVNGESGETEGGIMTEVGVDSQTKHVISSEDAGHNVIIEGCAGAPKVTKDGVAKSIEFNDRVKNVGASRLCVAFLAFDVIFVVICVAVGSLIGIAVCCRLPCIIAILYALSDQVKKHYVGRTIATLYLFRLLIMSRDYVILRLWTENKHRKQSRNTEKKRSCTNKVLEQILGVLIKLVKDLKLEHQHKYNEM